MVKILESLDWAQNTIGAHLEGLAPSYIGYGKFLINLVPTMREGEQRVNQIFIPRTTPLIVGRKLLRITIQKVANRYM